MRYKYLFTIDCLNSIIESHHQLPGIDFLIVKNEEDDMTPFYYFTSPHLTSLVEPKEVWARGLFLLALYKGAYHLGLNPFDQYDWENHLRLIKLFEWESDRNITPANSNQIVPFATFCETVLSKPLSHNNAFKPEHNRITNLVFNSRSKPDVKNILMQLGYGLDWINLYSILDSVKTYCRKISKKHYNNVLTQAGFSQKIEKKFTGTANNFGLLNTNARHGDLNYSIPSETMILPEAKDFIIKVCNSYLSATHNL